MTRARLAIGGLGLVLALIGAITGNRVVVWVAIAFLVLAILLRIPSKRA